MHRLGGTLAPSSAPSLALSSTATLVSSSSTSQDNPWGALHVLVLPLFNSEPLRVPIEDLNALVRKHIATVVSNAPSKALATLETETADLLAAGMDTFNGKLQGVPDSKLLSRVVELWGFFWDQVLPYVEGALLPLQTDPLLASLYRTQKSHRGSSPTRTTGRNHSFSYQSYAPALSTAHIDVRTLALRCFRDRLILPAFPRLHARIAQQKAVDPDAHTLPRAQQMLLVLVSQARRAPPSVSLTAPAPAPLPGESAAAHLLRLVRAPAPSSAPEPAHRAARTLSFLSGNVPRDRRGRIARRPQSLRLEQGQGQPPSATESEEDASDEGAAGGETPRTGFAPAPAHARRARDLQMLDSLRSPEAPDSAGTNPPGAGTRGGGWGLDGASWEERGAEDEDEGAMDWDQAQAAVERMVGLRAPEQPAQLVRPDVGRRRMT